MNDEMIGRTCEAEQKDVSTTEIPEIEFQAVWNGRGLRQCFFVSQRDGNFDQELEVSLRNETDVGSHTINFRLTEAAARVLADYVATWLKKELPGQGMVQPED